MVLLPLKDAQEVQFLKDYDENVQRGQRNAENWRSMDPLYPRNTGCRDRIAK